ncbi:MAG: tRNA lysidine(34) synthetase TilS [Lewinellaceae bacterium]|nr:tRNA lysidine(34) synthetase TilS [Lewinellaceae bacterium]
MSPFLTTWTNHLESRRLTGKRMLLAVSGGIDSVVMADLAFRSKLDFGIGHCNFHLRGEASDGDAEFVRTLADRYGVPFFRADFHTEQDALDSGKSIHETAREQRYGWLEETRIANNFDLVATAHHLNDSIETALINFTRGTGIRGLLGVPETGNRLIRPLLWATREEIAAYAEETGLEYREDSSNDTDKYTRNKIRHKIIPVLKELNPGLEQTAARNFHHLSATASLYEWAVKELGSRYKSIRENTVVIDLAVSRDFPDFAGSLLYEWIREFGFLPNQASDVLNAGESGAVFNSPTHKMVRDRGQLLIEPLAQQQTADSYLITRETQLLDLPEGRLALRFPVPIPDQWPDHPDIAFFDADKLTFPLTLRRWQSGDFFHPLGMGGKRQKLQDFFSNRKLTLFDKERTWLLCSAAGEIAWVVGLRADERFKIGEGTKAVLRVEFDRITKRDRPQGRADW